MWRAEDRPGRCCRRRDGSVLSTRSVVGCGYRSCRLDRTRTSRQWEGTAYRPIRRVWSPRYARMLAISYSCVTQTKAHGVLHWTRFFFYPFSINFAKSWPHDRCALCVKYTCKKHGTTQEDLHQQHHNLNFWLLLNNRCATVAARISEVLAENMA